MKINPAFVEAYGNLGLTLASLDRIDDAIGAFSRILEIDPNALEAHRNLANLFLQKEMPEEAGKHLRAILRLNPNDERADLVLKQILRKQEKGDVRRP